MRVLFVASVVVMLGGGAASAQDALDRYEAASEAIGAKMNVLLARELPKIANNLPETDWDDAHRQAGLCILQTLVDEAGIDYVAAMLSALEQAITEDCGLTALSMQRMAEAGTFEAMQ